MANNRMFLVHVPTGFSICLGKRMGWGWFSTNENLHKDINFLFDMLEKDYQYAGNQDDFKLALEDNEDAPSALHLIENMKNIEVFVNRVEKPSPSNCFWSKLCNFLKRKNK